MGDWIFSGSSNSRRYREHPPLTPALSPEGEGEVRCAAGETLRTVGGPVAESRQSKTQSATFTNNVVPLTPTTSTIAPTGKSGPLTSHKLSPTFAFPRPCTIGSANT